MQCTYVDRTKSGLFRQIGPCTRVANFADFVALKILLLYFLTYHRPWWLRTTSELLNFILLHTVRYGPLFCVKMQVSSQSINWFDQLQHGENRVARAIPVNGMTCTTLYVYHFVLYSDFCILKPTVSSSRLLMEIFPQNNIMPNSILANAYTCLIIENLGIKLLQLFDDSFRHWKMY